MNTSFTQLVAGLSRNFRKPVLFAIFGAAGALIGALFGELLARHTAQGPGAEGARTQITLLIDSSGSMSANNRMEEAKSAAIGFVRRTDFTNDLVGLVAFASRAAELVAPTTNPSELLAAINQLQPLDGTAMDAGFLEAGQQLGRSAGNVKRAKAILLFTDGMPSDPASTVTVAEALRKADVRIVAVGTGDAAADFLAQVTGDQSLVFFANQGGFENAFKQAEKILRRPQLIDSGTGNYTLGASLLRNVGWAACIAVGLALLLIAGQNAYQRRELFASTALQSAMMGSAIAGVVAGVVAQVGLQVVAGTQAGASLAEWIRVPAWAALGALLGRGVAGVVPNLKRPVAMKGGAIGGAVAGVALLLVAASMGASAARFVGAAILGAFVGYGIAWLEERAREACLVVHWGPNENTILSLGADPVIIGSSREAHVYLAAEKGFPPIAGVVSFHGGQVQFENRMNAQQYTLRNGSRLQLSNVTLEVKTA